MTQAALQRITAGSLAVAGLLIALFWITHPETLAAPDVCQPLRRHRAGVDGC
ncbi:MAG: hypothetical protein WBO46_00585 [Caldilineaceae bacterium]